MFDYVCMAVTFWCSVKAFEELALAFDKDLGLMGMLTGILVAASIAVAMGAN